MRFYSIAAVCRRVWGGLLSRLSSVWFALLLPADGEHREFQLEHFVAVLVFLGDECDFLAEGVDAFHDAVVAFLADAEGESRDVAAARHVAVDGVGGEL